jgi:hypothetical protein
VIVASASPAVLWPPAHQLVEVSVSMTVFDQCGQGTVTRLASVTSDEPDDAPGGGDGRTAGDIRGASIGAPDTSVTLRAERDGKGAGRHYTLTYTATDDSGHAAVATLVVTVPHSR